VLERRDLGCLRWVKYGGEPFPPRHLQALMALWPNARFSNVYGPAEVNQCTFYHVPPLSGDMANAPIPIGRVWGNSEGLVLDANDQPVTPGGEGELVIRSATMMQGYWNQSELTARAFYRRDARDGLTKVFYRTGDLVRLQEDGLLLFLGRRDRQIKTRGHRVELDDVEAALVACSEVLESAAYVVDDGEGSRVIEAAVTPRTDAELMEATLMAHAKQHLPPYAVPLRIAIRPDFPRTTTGKVDRLALQREAEETRALPLEIGPGQN
jgi:acyl-coenzyme A synthetase/AMP-(fatty) acid ligase